MKSINLLLVACVMMHFVFGSCGNGHKSTETKEDTKETTKESTKETTMTTSADLTFWELIGPVRICDEVEFDRQGMMVKYGQYNPFTIDEPYREIDEEGYMEEFAKWERNGAGQISTITGIEGMTKYKWSNGVLVHYEGIQEGTKYNADFEYDADGLLVKMVEYSRNLGDEEDEMPLWSTTEYFYLEFDDQDNWIRRDVSVTYADYDFTESYEETRTIKYYE